MHVEPAQPFLARQRAEIGRRLPHARIGDEDVRCPGTRRARPRALAASVMSAGTKATFAPVSAGDLVRRCLRAHRALRATSIDIDALARQRERRGSPEPLASAADESAAACNSEIHPSLRARSSDHVRKRAIQGSCSRHIRCAMARARIALVTHSTRRERAGQQPRRHAEAAGDVLQLLALGDDLRLIAARPARVAGKSCAL